MAASVSGDLIERLELTQNLVRSLPEKIHFFLRNPTNLGKEKTIGCLW